MYYIDMIINITLQKYSMIVNRATQSFINNNSYDFCIFFFESQSDKFIRNKLLISNFFIHIFGQIKD